MSPRSEAPQSEAPQPEAPQPEAADSERWIDRPVWERIQWGSQPGRAGRELRGWQQAGNLAELRARAPLRLMVTER
ncbi:MAG TPA: hypothetical protein QGF05_06310 [Dehalococcoidia bacterium]|nr:hypothetical protein [Dehalococcoidia bacterium]